MTKTNLELCKCEECPLYELTYKRGRVPGRGHDGETADRYSTVFVGIAPAVEELKWDPPTPFVGQSGKLLRQSAAKLGYEDYYLTNAILCYMVDSLSNADQRRAVACCHDRLLAEIEAADPDLVVAFGNVPLRALTGEDYGIKSVEGRILPGLKAPVLPVSHPAALLRNPEGFIDFKEALQVGISWLDGTYQQAVIPEMIEVTEDNIAEVCESIERHGKVAVDLETTKKGFYAHHRDPDQIRCMALAVDERSGYIVPGESSEHFDPHHNLVRDERLKKVLSKVDCIYHHGQFDATFLKCAGYDAPIYFDTMLAHYMYDERSGTHGLKHLAGKYLGAPDWESDIKNYLPNKKSSYDLIPTQKLYEYAACDVAYTFQLYEMFKKKLTGATEDLYYNLMVPGSNMFTEIRHDGIRIDVGVLMELGDKLEYEFEQSVSELAEMCGKAINPMAPQEVARILFDDLGLPDVHGRSTAKEILDELSAISPVASKVKECRQLNKLRSTYVINTSEFVDWNWCVHPLTKMFGTVTGRLSTEDPSVMNIPRDSVIKEMFIPMTEGNLILELDADQAELRSYVLLSGDEHLREVLNRPWPDGDPHRIVAVEAWGEDRASDMRVKAKNTVFGRLFRGGDRAIMGSTGLDSYEVRRVIRIVDSFFPGIAPYADSQIETVKKQGYVESFFGRRRRFGLITRESQKKVFKQATNFGIQSTASDVNLFAMLHLFKNRHKWGIRPMFPVHDSILIEIPDKSVIPDIVREVEEYVYELVEGKMKFTYGAKVGPNWREVVKV